MITITVNDTQTERVTFTIGQIPDEGNLIAVGDIFIFGQDPEQLENAAVTRNANAIYRMLLEETGDNTAMYTGSIEYTALNQLNVGDSDTYAGLATIDDEITIIVPTDLTDEDAVRVDYLDTDGKVQRKSAIKMVYTSIAVGVCTDTSAIANFDQFTRGV